MSDAKHTPGPWRTNTTGYVYCCVGDGTTAERVILVANVGAYRDKELLRVNKDRWDADARLIAAAPELLDCVKAALNMIDGDGLPPNWDLLRAALAKAGASDE